MRDKELGLNALHLLVLWGFAVAQPLFNVIDDGPEFFVAHHLGPAGIVAFVAALSLGPPLVLVLLESAVRLFSRPLYRALHLVLVFLLIAAFLASALNGLRSAIAILGSTFLLGVLATWAYARIESVRAVVTIASPSILIFPLLFLGFTPVSKLFVLESPAEAAARMSSGAPIGNPAPVVFIVFDEFEAGGLLDRDKEIDPVRFPHFAALAKDAWWFPRATTVAFQTVRAVPSILTGLRPRDLQSPPTSAAHPDNLFTWLGSSYRLNVHESLTRLCPHYLACGAGAVAAFEAQTFASDIAVLYLHIVLPPRFALRLPSLENDWKGFRAGGASRPDDPGHTDRFIDRRGPLDQFTRSIDSAEQKRLHFLHVLVPHTPYAYLPSGSTYSGGDHEGLSESRRWINDEYLPTVAYHRYLLQVGFVDTYIGRLVSHLKQIGIYDSALIVITADHGKSFRPGQPARNLVRDNAPDILNVPLFIKLPGQTEGRRSDRLALTTDILPTVAAALDSKLPWTPDGTSLTGESFPDRFTTEIHLPDKTNLQFAIADLTSYPRLGWKLRTFGDRRSWSETAAADPHGGLVGMRVADLITKAAPTGLQVVSNQIELFENVQSKSGLVPALLQGTVEGAPAEAKPIHLAVALGGIVRATTRTANWAGSNAYFMAVVPEAAIQDGDNRLEVFRIEGEAGAVSLVSLPLAGRDFFRISSKGNVPVLLSKQKELTVEPQLVRGTVEALESIGGWATVKGWAIDTKTVSPAARVMVFADDEQVYGGQPNVGRNDLQQVFQSISARNGGFLFVVPESRLKGKTVRVFGTSVSGVASELDVLPQARAGLQ